MTVSTTTNKSFAEGNGVTLSFPFSFVTLDPDHIVVYVNGIEQVSGYSVSLSSDQNTSPGGSVVFDSAPTAGYEVTIVRIVPLTQLVDYVAYDAFPAEVHEEALDKLTLLIQQLDSAKTNDFGFADSVSDVGKTKVILSASDRANKLLAFDSEGDLVASQEIGSYRGAWASGIVLNQRDIWLHSNGNYYYVVTSHATVSEADSVSKSLVFIDINEIETYRDEAAASASAAATSETNAANSASAAATSETNAANSASAAATSATNAANSASAAATSATNAANSASAAATSEANAAAIYDDFDDRYLGPKTTDPTTDNDGDPLVEGALYFRTLHNKMMVYSSTLGWINAASDTALSAELEGYRDEAAASASAAATSETNAATSETNAANSASAAATSATNAANSASAAATSASSASSSASSASSSASNASVSAVSAANSATSASSSASSAASDASSANTSAINAANSASAAAASETNAAASESSAASSASSASSSATSADNSEASALLYKNQTEVFKDQAYQYSLDAASAVYQDLSSIAAEKAVTAVDVFVYDTSRDSDGGAWRNRCQHTSWYNEPLNTATRGSRKEFPAVAVIVAESDKVTIYDGDDPSLPMWMVFNHTSNALHSLFCGGGGPTSPVSVVMGEGSIFLGVRSDDTFSGGVISLSLITEFARYYRNAISSATGAIYTRNIAQRNVVAAGAYSGDYNDLAIVNANVREIAMTVLPSAPVDPTSGLQIPTIAAATDGGVSVIKDDGSVVDITFSNDPYEYVDSISFTDDNRVIFYTHNAANYRHVKVYEIPDSDITESSHYVRGSAAELYTGFSSAADEHDLFFPYNPAGGTAYFSGRNIGAPNGLITIDANPDTPSDGMLTHITSTYNSGWMAGDVKGAWLADTTAETISGSELVTNGTFDTDISGWNDTSSVGGSISWNASGALDIVYTSGTARANQLIAVEVGKPYTISIDCIAEGTGRVYSSSGATTLIAGEDLVAGETYTKTIIPTSTELSLTVSEFAATSTIDNISVRPVEEDRSVNNKPLNIIGSLTKSPVATGSDLVAYSGFSSTNYLEQPYNPDLDFGTEDFYVMGWGDLPLPDRNIMTRALVDFSSPYIDILTAGSKLAFQIGDGVSVATAQALFPTDSVMRLFAFIKRDSELEIWSNGTLITSVSTGSVGSLNNVGASVRFGADFFGVRSAASCRRLLWRIGAGAPTADQIKKIYEDEKVLFQENAACTLYGSSDAVTALAHDPVTDLLHVGTSAGRSVFKGLRRVDNTTDAVGSAISAVNNLVVED